MDASPVEAPLIYFRRMGTLGELDTVLGVLGRLKERRRILSTSSLPTLISDSALWQKQQGKDNSLPTCIFGMGDVKEEENHMTYVPHDSSSALLLWKIDPYWNSQLLVEYSKDIFSCMILDDQLHEEGYSVRDGVIYYHGRIFSSRDSKLKEKFLLASHEYFLFSHTYSMRSYHTIMEGYIWEGFEEEIYSI